DLLVVAAGTPRARRGRPGAVLVAVVQARARRVAVGLAPERPPGVAVDVQERVGDGVVLALLGGVARAGAHVGAAAGVRLGPGHAEVLPVRAEVVGPRERPLPVGG